MKLSKETLTLIKNYASINSNLLLKPGKKLATMAVGNKIFSSATIAEDFPVQFPIYDVNELLSVLSLFNDPDIDFSEKYLTIQEGKASLKYFAAAIEGLIVPPDREANLGDAIITFDLDSGSLATVLRTAPILKVQGISFVGDGSTVSLVVADKKNATSNSYSTVVGTTDKAFKVNVAVENIKMLPGDYEVSISQRGIKFKSKAADLTYYVAIELDSKFE